MTSVHRRFDKLLRIRPTVVLTLICLLAAPVLCYAQTVEEVVPELVRPVRTWEFLSALGTRGGIFGDEGGNLEAWIYPLKIFRNFHLRFKVDGQTIDGKALARSLSVRPESTTITYVWDTFSVRETIFVPVDEPGAIIQLDVQAAQPLEIEAVFERDFQLEWPGTMGGTDVDWNPALHAFAMTENQHKFNALVGSPSAANFTLEYVTNYSSSRENAIGFGIIGVGQTTRQIVIAASFADLPAVETTYRKLSNSYAQLLASSQAYYRSYLDSHVSLELPDADLQEAYQWAQVSVLQGLVKNPYLGMGLVAGYRGSGDDQRPGYAWFFGRDALWTVLALDAEQDFATARIALQFLSKYQRADGKVPHEIAQGASFVPWFESMPYAYASADASPLYIIAMNDYVHRSGDIAFARESWDNLWRAYKFISSTYDSDGLPRNQGVGHGWVEGGPLLPIRTELYQSGVVVEALEALASLADTQGKRDVSESLRNEYNVKKSLLNQAFWIPSSQRYAFALDLSGKQVDTPSVLATVPMWFGLLDDQNAEIMLARLSQPDIQSDWGMRIIPTSSPKYEAAGYHSGTVWPLFTGWASVAEYKYHQAFAAYGNLRTNALLTFDGSLGHVTEVLSGNYYQTLATGSPQQVWSSSMVISPMLTGLFGLEVNSAENNVKFSPHIPANWTHYSIHQVHAGGCTLNFNYRRAINRMTLTIEHRGESCTLDFSPGVSYRTDITSVELNGRQIPFKVDSNKIDRHLQIHLNISDSLDTILVHTRDDFGFSQDSQLPALGSGNQGMRITSVMWSEDRDMVKLETASAMGGTYSLELWNPSQIASIDGAELIRREPNSGELQIKLSKVVANQDAHQEVVIHFNNSHSHDKDSQRPN